MIDYYLACDCLQIEKEKAVMQIKYALRGGGLGYYEFFQAFQLVDGYINLGDMSIIEGVRPDGTDWRLEREQILDTLNDTVLI